MSTATGCQRRGRRGWSRSPRCRPRADARRWTWVRRDRRSWRRRGQRSCGSSRSASVSRYSIGRAESPHASHYGARRAAAALLVVGACDEPGDIAWRRRLLRDAGRVASPLRRRTWAPRRCATPMPRSAHFGGAAGTISLIAATTARIEPMFAIASRSVRLTGARCDAVRGSLPAGLAVSAGTIDSDAIAR